MIVTYITHSCFLIELTNCYLLFDYFKGNIPVLKEDKPLYVFASHKHQDHFDKKIFELSDQKDKVFYILSKDIRLSDSFLNSCQIPLTIKEKIFRIGKNVTEAVHDLKIETLTSTDEGVAFLVNTDDKTIYHAGDLNWWHWEGEEKSWNRNMEKRYMDEINKIDGRHIDLAFVPVDPRLQDAYYLGIQYFLTHTKTDMTFPMHFWKDYSVIEKLREREDMLAFKEKIMVLAYEGETFDIR